MVWDELVVFSSLNRLNSGEIDGPQINYQSKHEGWHGNDKMFECLNVWDGRAMEKRQ